MPIISMFYGIIIRMYTEPGNKHHLPHIHAEYGEEKIEVSFDGEVLAGKMRADYNGARKPDQALCKRS